MAVKIPQLELSQRPTPQPSGGIASYRGATGAEGMVGEAMTRAAGALEHASAETFSAWKQEEAKTNTLRAEEAFSKLRERQLDLTAGEQNGYLQKKGADAITRPLAKEWGDKFNQAYRELESSLGNDEQKALFKQRATIARLQFDEGMLHHLARQNAEFAKQTDEGVTKVEVRQATANWQNPEAVALSLERIRASTEARAKSEGWAPEATQATIQQRAGQVHSAVIGQALASGQLGYAEKYYNEHKADIDAPTAKALERAVEDGSQRELSNGYRADMLASQNDYKALGKLRDQILADPKLDDGRRNALVGPIQNQMIAIERRNEAARERAERRAEKAIDAFNADTLAGFPGNDPERGLQMLQQVKGTALEPQARAALQLAQATRAFSNLPPREQEAQLAAAEAAVRQDPSKVDRRILSAWQSIAMRQKEQVQKDPQNFAVRQGIAPPKPLDLTNPAGLGDALAERFSIARYMEQKYNAPFKPLSVEETALLQARLKNAPAREKRNYFAGLAQAAGTDYQGYSGLMAQLATDDPVTAQAGLYAYRGRTEASNRMLDGLQLLNPPRKEDGKPDQGKLWPMPPEAEMRKAFQSYEKDAFAGRPETRNAMYQATVAIYASKSKDGDASGVFSPSRWDEAIKLATGGIEKYKGKAIVLPYGYDYGQFQTELGKRIDQVVEQGRLAEGMNRARLADMRIEPVGDGQYVFVSGDGVLVDKDNKRIVVDFNTSTPYRPSGQHLIDFGAPVSPDEERVAREAARAKVKKKQ